MEMQRSVGKLLAMIWAGNDENLMKVAVATERRQG